MITVLILMLVLVSITYLFASAVFADLAIARNNKGAQIAFNLAEAGVQEAIYKVRDDPAIRSQFLNNPTYNQTFTHSPALINNGSYSYTIHNTAKGVATVTSTASFTMGLRTAQRMTRVVIAQAFTNGYQDTSAMFTDAQSSSTGDLEFNGATINIYDGGLTAGRDLNLSQGSIVKAEKDVKYVKDWSLKQSSTLKYDCLIGSDPDPLVNPPANCDSGDPSVRSAPVHVLSDGVTIPMINIDGDNGYKSVAEALNQVFTPQQFLNLIPPNGQTATFNGIVFITGGLNLDGNRNIIINGVLASADNITIGSNSGSDQTTLTLNPNSNGDAGIITSSTIGIQSKGNLSGTGLLYALSSNGLTFNNSTRAVDLIGGILARKITVTNRTVNIHFDSSVINNTLGNPNDTPVVELSHWEEEY